MREVITYMANLQQAPAKMDNLMQSFPEKRAYQASVALALSNVSRDKPHAYPMSKLGMSSAMA